MTDHKEQAERLTIEELRIYANEYRNRLRHKKQIKTNVGLSDKETNMSDIKEVSDNQELKEDLSDNTELNIFK
jgi:hypothetical protein